MGIKNRITALEVRHAAKNAQIILLLATSPSCDHLQLSKLRREKLRCKDEIARLKNPQRRTAPKPPVIEMEVDGMFSQSIESHISVSKDVKGIHVTA